MKNKVDLDDVLGSIEKEEFILLPDGRTTICMLTLKNGFTIRGESSCVDISNYNPEIGNKIARTNAQEKIWAFLGYELATKLRRRTNIYSRMEEEQRLLSARFNSLGEFIESPKFKNISSLDQNDLREQHKHMMGYLHALNRRINRNGTGE